MNGTIAWIAAEADKPGKFFLFPRTLMLKTLLIGIPTLGSIVIAPSPCCAATSVAHWKQGDYLPSWAVNSFAPRSPRTPTMLKPPCSGWTISRVRSSRG